MEIKQESLNCTNEIFTDCDTLIKDSKNFNLHIKVLKRLLNLKERNSGYDIFLRPKSPEKDYNNITQVKLIEKMKQLKQEIEESHRLGFCLAYNIQRLQKRLTGLPIDINSGTDFLKNLEKKFQWSKNREAVIKYDFQIKRKLLGNIKSQMEETREYWKNLKLKKPKFEENKYWTEAIRKRLFRKEKQSSIESGFGESGPSGTSGSDSNSPIQSDDGDTCDDLLAEMDDRKTRLDTLEEECYNLLSNFVNHPPSPEKPESTFETISNLEEFIDIPHEISDLDHHALQTTNIETIRNLQDDIDIDVDAISLELSESIESLEEVEVLPDPIDDQSNFDTEEADVSDLPWDSNITEPLNLSLPFPNISQQMPLNLSLEEGLNNEMEFAETGEPSVLCRLRRRAVETLISRLRDEKILNEKRENELREQIENLREQNIALEKQIKECHKWRMQLGIILSSVLISLLLAIHIYK